MIRLQPAAETATTTEEIGQPALKAALSSALRVLIVSDVPASRQLLAYYLDELPHELREARSTGEALTMYAQAPGALIILDGDLPEDDLMRFIAQLRAFEGEHALPPASILGLASSEAQADQLRRAGCTCTLPRPVQRTDLRHMVLRLAPLPRQRSATARPRSEKPRPDGRRKLSATSITFDPSADNTEWLLLPEPDALGRETSAQEDNTPQPNTGTSSQTSATAEEPLRFLQPPTLAVRSNVGEPMPVAKSAAASDVTTQPDKDTTPDNSAINANSDATANTSDSPASSGSTSSGSASVPPIKPVRIQAVSRVPVADNSAPRPRSMRAVPYLPGSASSGLSPWTGGNNDWVGDPMPIGTPSTSQSAPSVTTASVTPTKQPVQVSTGPVSDNLTASRPAARQPAESASDSQGNADRLRASLLSMPEASDVSGGDTADVGRNVAKAQIVQASDASEQDSFLPPISNAARKTGLFGKLTSLFGSKKSLQADDFKLTSCSTDSSSTEWVGEPIPLLKDEPGKVQTTPADNTATQPQLPEISDRTSAMEAGHQNTGDAGIPAAPIKLTEPAAPDETPIELTETVGEKAGSIELTEPSETDRQPLPELFPDGNRPGSRSMPLPRTPEVSDRTSAMEPERQDTGDADIPAAPIELTEPATPDETPIELTETVGEKAGPIELTEPSETDRQLLPELFPDGNRPGSRSMPLPRMPEVSDRTSAMEPERQDTGDAGIPAAPIELTEPAAPDETPIELTETVGGKAGSELPELLISGKGPSATFMTLPYTPEGLHLSGQQLNVPQAKHSSASVQGTPDDAPLSLEIPTKSGMPPLTVVEPATPPRGTATATDDGTLELTERLAPGMPELRLDATPLQENTQKRSAGATSLHTVQPSQAAGAPALDQSAGQPLPQSGSHVGASLALSDAGDPLQEVNPATRHAASDTAQNAMPLLSSPSGTGAFPAAFPEPTVKNPAQADNISVPDTSATTDHATMADAGLPGKDPDEDDMTIYDPADELDVAALLNTLGALEHALQEAARRGDVPALRGVSTSMANTADALRLPTLADLARCLAESDDESRESLLEATLEAARQALQ